MREESELVILKLGGSVITDKTKKFSFRKGKVSEFGSDIRSFFPDKKFIIVHGGGSFGHPLAEEYNIISGLKKNKQRKGFYETHKAMIDLNKKVLKNLSDQGLPVFPVSPSSTFMVDSGDPNYFDLKVVKELLGSGFIPVLYGDVALDSDQGINILSGDQIIKALVKDLKSSQKITSVIFLADVDGVYDKDPDDPRANLLEEVSNSMVDDLGGSAGIDVTGGIQNKVREMLKIADLDPEVELRLSNGLKNDLITIIENKDLGTRIVAENE